MRWLGLGLGLIVLLVVFEYYRATSAVDGALQSALNS
jgi:hypothetical protein